MTIWTTAASVAKHGVCDGGTERTAEALAKRGMTMDDRVTMQVILNDLGLTDTLFSFCEVEKKSRNEADRVIRAYIMEVVSYAMRFLTLTAAEKTKEVLADANKAINKRCEGISRPALSRRSFVAVARAKEQVFTAHEQHWMDVYKIVLSPKPDHVVAVHATIALLDGCRTMEFDDDIQWRLRKFLKDKLGPCPILGE